MSEQRLQTLAGRIANPEARDKFFAMMIRANALAAEAAELRRDSWDIYYSDTGLKKGETWGKWGPYA